MDLLIKNATFLDGKKKDILIQENKIAKIASDISVSVEKFNARGKLVIPGFVNTHTHISMNIFRGLEDDSELENWLGKIWKFEKKLSSSAVYAAAELACIEMIQTGTTCFSDMYFFMDQVASAAKKIGVRAVLGYGLIDNFDSQITKKEISIAEEFIKNWHKKAEGRITCSVSPHSIYTCSKELLLKANELSIKYNLPFHIHLSETRKEFFECLKNYGLKPVNYLDSLGLVSNRLIAAHAVWLTREEIKILGSKKASVSLCPVSNAKLACGSVSPLAELKEFDVNISLGTDGPASNNSLSMLESMKFLALLQKHSRWDAKITSASEVFSFATDGGARALNLPIGKIQEGYLADLVFLDLKSPNLLPYHSIVSNIVYSSNPLNISDVIIDGKFIMQDREFLSVDVNKIIENFQKEVEKLFS
jgi:5-methylthioadenosine/S-adenosylhomocysteine deaminase